MAVRPQCPPEAKVTRRPKTVRGLPLSENQYRSVFRNGSRIAERLVERAGIAERSLAAALGAECYAELLCGL